MPGNAERFLNAYASIEMNLKRIVNDTRYIPFSQLLSRAAKNNKIVSIHEQDLRDYNELRNAIVHERGKNQEIIAEPCDSVTEDIEHIAAILNEKNDILSFSSSPVRTVRSDTDIPEVFQLMQRLDTSKIPVYDEGRYTGIITVEEIAEWALDENKSTMKTGDIIQLNRDERVLFVSRKNPVESVTRAFENALNHGVTLLAIIITEKGSLKEKPLGIITVADLPKILKSFG